MKNSFLTIIALMLFTVANAQVESKTPAQQKPSEPMPQSDTTSTNAQIRKEADIKNMDAVKTDDHVKVSPKVQSDTTAAKNKNRSAKRKAARP